MDSMKSILFSAFMVTIGVANISYGQRWLTDNTYRGAQLPPVPTVPSAEGLVEPPPPLAPQESVFAPDVETISSPKVTEINWYNPWTWIPKDNWVNSAELGINGSAGNSEAFSFQAGTRFKRHTDFTLFDVRMSHNQTSAQGIATQNNTLIFVDWERNIGQSRWSTFIKNGLEWDEFKAFDLRYFINSGLSYNIYNTKDLKLAARFGAGASREFGGPDDRWVPEALFGGTYEHQVNARNKLIAKIDYFPEWTNFENYRLISDVAWEYLLDEKGNLSMKLGALNRYDSTPNGTKASDLNYSALILYKF